MSEHHDYLRTGDRKFRLTADITALMLKGAGYAALFCLAVLLAGWALLALSRLLPEDSKFAPDPINRSFLLIEQVERAQV
ncbi:RC-LH1 core complex protein PufX [Marivita sp. GX14005]|uniref:RC-LH1 core complex protein PufX n=1 Tax=Marivita sp. GX14005 TaxID=2942276 RepID=UPI0020197DDE|nr:RC-LH1 core complex protein PufX [Marivita sp. GX14005]MCL3883078.1 RC-LH1 core complex protein PufX [Marivita sp. GX14005]